MSSQDEADPEALQERVNELEATVQKMLPGRRAFLAAGAGAAVGAVGMREASNVGEAADGTAVGQIGTSSEPVNVVAHDVTSDSADTEQLNSKEVITEGRYSGDLGSDINDAVAALPPDGGIIEIEPRSDGSRYLLSTRTILDKNIRLIGPGREISCISVDADVLAVEGRSPGVSVEELNIIVSSGARSSHTSDLIHLGGRMRAYRCKVSYAGRNGIVWTDAYAGNIYDVINCRASDCGQNVATETYEGNGMGAFAPGDLGYPKNDGSGMNVGRWEGCEGQSNANHGIVWGYYNGNTATACEAEGNGGNGFYLQGSGDNSLIGIWGEANGGDDLFIDQYSDNNKYRLVPGAATVTDNGTNNTTF